MPAEGFASASDPAVQVRGVIDVRDYAWFDRLRDADIPADQLTHVIYSFLNVTSNGEVALYDSFAAVDKRFAGQVH